jgi:hypothetical protein
MSRRFSLTIRVLAVEKSRRVSRWRPSWMRICFNSRGRAISRVTSQRGGIILCRRCAVFGRDFSIDQPLVPRTNNEIEIFYNQLKRQRRRNTGRKGTQDYLVRYGPYLVCTQDKSEATVLSHFRCVKQGDLRAQRLAMRHKAERRQVMWRFRHHRDDFCADLKRRWDQVAATPSP